LARAAEQDGAPAAVTVTPIDNGLEAIVFADDRRGLLADLAGAVAACGLSVRSLHALTTKDEKALDIFDVQSADGAQINDQGQARRLHGALLSAARASPASPPRWTRRLGDRRSIFHVTPKVRVDLEASEDAAIVEAEGLDRPGLIYDLAGALRDLETQIASAHIATYGERAVDAFYLKDRAGRKITDAEALARIEQRLIDVLSAGSGA
jgi:[protein-PII] uridylyltransferase